MLSVHLSNSCGPANEPLKTAEATYISLVFTCMKGVFVRDKFDPGLLAFFKVRPIICSEHEGIQAGQLLADAPNGLDVKQSMLAASVQQGCGSQGWAGSPRVAW